MMRNMGRHPRQCDTVRVTSNREYGDSACRARIPAIGRCYEAPPTSYFLPPAVRGTLTRVCAGLAVLRTHAHTHTHTHTRTHTNTHIHMHTHPSPPIAEACRVADAAAAAPARGAPAHAASPRRGHLARG
eukprot:scaffold89310_cov29-Phaeocystis_antarctica.AAC.1